MGPKGSAVLHNKTCCTVRLQTTDIHNFDKSVFLVRSFRTFSKYLSGCFCQKRGFCFKHLRADSEDLYPAHSLSVLIKEGFVPIPQPQNALFLTPHLTMTSQEVQGLWVPASIPSPGREKERERAVRRSYSTEDYNFLGLCGFSSPLRSSQR